ncbi:hypothetical protein QH494_14260 [Sphingomonas sp. AR_OL41]|uniref:hypothetical protein n=1 Tax=Sphingomonas sp. AR_OL41 TaxID=3042729 RepID=UPI002481064F|nr:hypothetical protein [Sphingomonas sp. AR_OL41]MDH7973349.1 hypothetical protein [Sphingomonas sp. AR_OL41]
MFATLADSEWNQSGTNLVDDLYWIKWSKVGSVMKVMHASVFDSFDFRLVWDGAGAPLRLEPGNARPLHPRTIAVSKTGFVLTSGPDGAHIRDTCTLRGTDLTCRRSFEHQGRWQDSPWKQAYQQRRLGSEPDISFSNRNHYPDLPIGKFDPVFGSLATVTGHWMWWDDKMFYRAFRRDGDPPPSGPKAQLRIADFNLSDQARGFYRFVQSSRGGAPVRADVFNGMNGTRRVTKPHDLSVAPGGHTIICADDLCHIYYVSDTRTKILDITFKRGGDGTPLKIRDQKLVAPRIPAKWGALQLMEGIAFRQSVNGKPGAYFIFHYFDGNDQFFVNVVDAEGRNEKNYVIDPPRGALNPSSKFPVSKIAAGKSEPFAYITLAGPTLFDWNFGRPDAPPPATALRISTAPGDLRAEVIALADGKPKPSGVSYAMYQPLVRGDFSESQRIATAQDAANREDEAARLRRAEGRRAFFAGLGNLLVSGEPSYVTQVPSWTPPGGDPNWAAKQREVELYRIRESVYGNGSGSSGNAAVADEPARPKPKPVDRGGPETNMYIYCIAASAVPKPAYVTEIYLRLVVRDTEATHKDVDERRAGTQVASDLNARWAATSVRIGQPGGVCYSSYDRSEMSRHRQMWYDFNKTRNIVTLPFNVN